MGCILKGGGGLYHRVTVGAVVLAAGSGSRMGHRPKCLLELGGVPLIRRLLIALSGAGIDELVVVLGHHAELIEPAIEAFPVTVVRNPSPDDGIESSQRLGLAALSPKLDAVVMALADQPLIQAQDVMDLIGAYKKRPEGTQVVVPHQAGERGNPVLLDASVRDAILSRAVVANGQEIFAARQWQAEHRDAVYHWATENRRYRVDLDHEDDIERFQRDTGHVLKWPPTMSAALTSS